VKKKTKEAVVANEEIAATVELKKEKAVESKTGKAEKIEMAVPVALKREKASTIEKAAVLKKEMAAAAATKKDKAHNIRETKKKVAAVKNEETEVEEVKAIAG
jgi:hypothetical protein